jgi:hypothetical protein
MTPGLGEPVRTGKINTKIGAMSILTLVTPGVQGISCKDMMKITPNCIEFL